MHPGTTLSAMRILNLGPDRVRRKSYPDRVRNEEGSNIWEKYVQTVVRNVLSGFQRGAVEKRVKGWEQ